MALVAKHDAKLETPRPEHWQKLGLPVPKDSREVLQVTHGLLRPRDDDGKG